MKQLAPIIILAALLACLGVVLLLVPSFDAAPPEEHTLSELSGRVASIQRSATRISKQTDFTILVGGRERVVVDARLCRRSTMGVEAGDRVVAKIQGANHRSTPVLAWAFHLASQDLCSFDEALAHLRRRHLVSSAIGSLLLVVGLGLLWVCRSEIKARGTVRAEGSERSG